MKSLIVPSVIAKSQEELDEIVGKVKNHFSVMQLDFMDGEFVKNKTFDFDFDLPKGIEYEAHLMVNDPASWIDINGSKVDWIAFHIEAVSKENLKDLLDKIKGLGKNVGIVINPETPVDEILKFINDVDMVIVMTVHPGKYGAEFLPETMDKVRRLREESTELIIEVDGGMNPENIKLAREAGANRFISGSYLLNSEDIEETSKKLNELIEGGD